MVRHFFRISFRTTSILVLATVFSLLFLTASDTLANNSAVDDVRINVPAACTMTKVNADSSEHARNVLNGSYETEIGITALKVICNDYDGFAIYAVGYSDDEIGNTEMISSDYATTGNISTGVYSAGTTTDSVWSMKINKVTNATAYLPGNLTINNGFNAYRTVPSIYTKIATYKAASGTSATDTTLGSRLETTYAVYVSNTQAPATYEGQVKYTLVHPSSTATNSVSGVLWAMQDVAGWKSRIQVGQEISVIDTRDSKIYKVAKLADGNVWMTQNLDFDIDSTVTYTNEDTDIGWNASTNSYGTASWTPSLSTYATNNNSWTSSWYIAESYDPGDYCWSGTVDDGAMVYCNQNGSHYHLGNYYTWTAAVAMNDSSSYITANTNVNQSICPRGWTLPKSGASDTGSGSFIYLVSQYGYSSGSMSNPLAWESPLYLTLGGSWVGYYVAEQNHSYIGWQGSYQSSTVGTQMQGRLLAKGLRVKGDNTVGPQTNMADRRSGFSIRCIAR